MTLAEAADQYERTTRQIKELEPQRDAAKVRLLEHFHKNPGRHHYKSRIGYSRTTRRSLDQDKVKQFLGDKLGRFMKERPVESLTLLDAKTRG